MKIYELLNKATRILLKKNKNKKISYKESEIILLSIINKSRDYLYRNFKNNINKKIIIKFLKKIKKRATGYPLQYLIGYEIFYGRKFHIQRGVFIPRPDSETLIEALKKLKFNAPVKCIDIGSGSGCLGITAVMETTPAMDITFIDKNKNAIKNTKKNLRLYNLKAKIIHQSFFNYIVKNKQKFDIAICNPPYISYKNFKKFQKEIKFEPKNALLAKKEGYDFYIKLAASGEKFLKPGGYLILEAGDNMAENIKKFFLVKWNYLFSVKDYINIERALVFQLRF
ncbi:MAG: peptide chain release factor N(5)-glutamine methyltransferase [Candidatus Goldbacteria bacterium]|nr:peptide chain release factor N(5)-glutamine methyltransferase [Candidatus Goldiibacteriota bacterium]